MIILYGLGMAILLTVVVGNYVYAIFVAINNRKIFNILLLNLLFKDIFITIYIFDFNIYL